MKTWVYVDGLNLFYGCLKGTPFKWLDIGKLCALLLPRHQVERIKYFTARVEVRSNDPDRPAKQDTYLRAPGPPTTSASPRARAPGSRAASAIVSNHEHSFDLRTSDFGFVSGFGFRPFGFVRPLAFGP